MSNSTSQIKPGPKTRRERVERREDAIVAAARTLFNNKGFSKTTIADIARQSGVADGTVYLYFKNKDDIARAVVDDFYNQLTESAQSGVDDLSTPRERLEFLARNHMVQVQKNFRILETISSLGPTFDTYEGSEIYELNKTYVAVFNRVAKNAVSQGVLRADVPLPVIRDIFFGAMEYGLRTLMMKRRDNDIEDFVKGLMATLLKAPLVTGKQNIDADLADRLNDAVTRMEHILENK